MNERAGFEGQVIHYLLEGISVLLLIVLLVAGGILHFTRPPLQYQPEAASLEETVQAEVLEVGEESVTEDATDLVQITQLLQLEILSEGELQGERIEVTYNGMGPTVDDVRFRPGDRALVMVTQRPSGETYYAVADHVRLLPLGALAALFALVTVLIGRWQGVRALLGLLLSALLIGGFILPQILAGRDPVLVTTVGVAALLAVTLYLIQGWNATAHTALLGMLVSLAITALLAIFWTDRAHLTGFGSEETLYLQATGVSIAMRGLLLGGVILGAAGVLDDVVLAQAVSIFEITRLDPTLPRREIFRRGMKVGNAHLASMVNTLVLAYASAALPLLILFYLYPEPWYLTINRELIAEELLRTLIGSLGLMLAVPLTTVIGAWVAPQMLEEAESAEEPEGASSGPVEARGKRQGL